MGKRVAAISLAAVLGLGTVAVSVLDPLGVAGAQDQAATESASADRAGPLARALDRLVAEGTITREQADAVLDATKAEAVQGRAERREQARARRAATVQVAADALGSTPDDVKAALGDGVSIAAQAEAAGVDRQVVDDALTAHLAGRIDAAVADGTLTEEQATAAGEHVDAAVDRILDADGSGNGGSGGHGHGRLRERLRERLGD